MKYSKHNDSIQGMDLWGTYTLSVLWGTAKVSRYVKCCHNNVMQYQRALSQMATFTLECYAMLWL